MMMCLNNGCLLFQIAKQALVSPAAGKNLMAVTVKVQMFFKPQVAQQKTVKSLARARMIALVLLKIHLKRFNQLYT